MENLNGLLVDIQLELATTTETTVAKTLLERAIELGLDLLRHGLNIKPTKEWTPGVRC